jgi:hypothetical protein
MAARLHGAIRLPTRLELPRNHFHGLKPKPSEPLSPALWANVPVQAIAGTSDLSAVWSYVVDGRKRAATAVQISFFRGREFASPCLHPAGYEATRM